MTKLVVYNSYKKAHSKDIMLPNYYHLNFSLEKQGQKLLLMLAGFSTPIFLPLNPSHGWDLVKRISVATPFISHLSVILFEVGKRLNLNSSKSFSF